MGDLLAGRRKQLILVVDDKLMNTELLKELLEWLRAPSEADRHRILSNVAARPNGDEQDVPAENALDLVVQVMTMHTAKGLSAEVVFVPGLEEQLLPGPRRAPFPGLVSEAARLLFVSMIRC